jgi:hypothetical protein
VIPGLTLCRRATESVDASGKCTAGNPSGRRREAPANNKFSKARLGSLEALGGPATREALALLAASHLAQNADASDRNSAKFLVPACQRFVTLSDGDTLVSALHQGVCVGIIEGIGYVSGSLPPGLRSCLPEGVTQEQTVGVILSYIKRRPEWMHEDFRELAIEAMLRRGHATDATRTYR